MNRRSHGGRLRRWLAGGCGLLPALLGAAPLQAERIAESVWFVQGEAALGSAANRNFISNAAFVVGDDGVLVIDALGSPALAGELLAEIRRVTPLPVRQVIVTHYHADHIYGLQVFAAAGASIVAHRGALEYLGSENAQRRLETSRQDLAPWVDASTRLVAADRWLDDGETHLRLGALDVLEQQER